MQGEGMTENTFHYENLRRRSRYGAVFAIMLLAFLAMIMININTGTVDISAARIGKIIFAGGEEGTEYHIIWLIRMPRVLMAAILGGALSLSGFLLQTGVCRFADIGGVCTAGFEAPSKYAVASGRRDYDLLYLLGGYGFYCDVCRGFGYCESAGVVYGKFFRDELGECEGWRADHRGCVSSYLPAV